MSKRNSFESENVSDVDEEERDTKKTNSSNKEDSPQSILPNYDLIMAISTTLNSILDQNKHLDNYKEILKAQSPTVFSGNLIPNISIKDYLLRIQNYANIEKSTLILSLIYIDRLCQKYKFKINYFNIYKLILTSMILAIKYNEDEFYSTEFYAKLGGITKVELNLMEYEFINLINFNLFVQEELYFKYHDLLLNDGNEESNEDEKDE